MKRCAKNQVLFAVSIHIGKHRDSPRHCAVGAGGREISLAIAVEDIQDAGSHHEIKIAIAGKSNRVERPGVP